MKLIIPFLFVVFISLSGCKTSPNEVSGNNLSAADTALMPLAKAEFKVNGMHCTGCENTIKTNVKDIQGVTSVDASFKKNHAVVTFDSTQTNEMAILSAIEDAGYKVDTFMRR